MTGEARKEGSKWDRKEGSPDIVEISEDESLPMNTDDYCKDGDLLPSQDFTNGNGKQLGESSNPKPDASMKQGSAGHEQERTDGFNKAVKERQSKASSERSQPPRIADEEHNNDDWGKSGLGKATGNQGMSRYADDRRRGGDGWGTTLGRGYSSRMPSDPDTWGARGQRRSPSPTSAWNTSRRNRSRSRSRSKSRSRSRSRSRGRRGRSRSRSPYFTDRGSEWRVERGRTSVVPALPCRDFAAGRCRRGSYCRFPHEDGGRRQFDEHYPGDSRERYGHQPKEFMDSREPNDYLRSRQSRGHYDKGTWERSEPRRDYRSTEQCHDFVKGRCSRGASCRYVHDDSASHAGWREEVRESAHGRGGPDSSYGARTEHRRANKNPCKFFAEGRCRRGQNCPYLHEEAPQSQMGLGAPDEPLNYSDGHTTRGNYSNWGEQTNATHASSQILSRDDRENPGSQGTGRSDSRYELKTQHLKDAGRNQYQIFREEDFGSQGQNKPEVAASQQPQFLNPIQTSADSTSNGKVSGMDGQSAPATTGNLTMQTGIHAANLIGGQNLGQIAQSQDAVPQIPGAPTLPVTTQLQNAASSLPLNSQPQQSDYSLLPNRQDQLVVPHAAANNSAPSMQSPPVDPYMGHNQHAYSLGAQALPDLSALNGRICNVTSQFPQNLPTTVHAAQSQAAIDIPKPSQDSGTQSIQNTHNFQPVTPNVQTQSQILQGLSVVPSSSSADMVGAPVSHNAATNVDVSRVAASLAQYFGNAAGTVVLQPSQPNLNSSLMITSSATPPTVQPKPWPWAQQQAGMVQPAPSVPSEQQAPQTFQIPMAVGSSKSSNGNPVLLPHLVAPTGHASTSVVNETVPSENKKGEPKDTDAEVHEDGDNKKTKDSKALKLFKLALADFVKDALKPTWKEGQLSREVHKTIVKKVVDKVTSTVENIPQTKEKIDIYMSYSREKLNKLVQAYVGKYVKT